MNLENIIGGTINLQGEIDRGYAEPTSFRVNNDGQILTGYNTPVAIINCGIVHTINNLLGKLASPVAIINCGIVHTGYNTDTGIRLTNY